MSTIKITELPSADTPLSGSEYIPLVQDNVTKKVAAVYLGGDVATISVATANGFAGVSSGGINPELELYTTVSGLLKGNGTAVSAAVSGTDYAPATSGTSLLYGNGSGGFSNVTIGSGVSFAGGTLSATGLGGTVTSVTATAPVASTGGTTPVISMPAATASTDGYLTSTDWNTFNNKQPAGAYLTTVTVDSPLTGSGTSASHLSIPAASATVSGYLTSADWATFNSKGSGTVTSVTATSPVASTGGTTPVISMPAATSTVSGYLTSTNWNTFNNKVTSVTATSPVASTGGTTPVISMPAATASVSGYLTSTDWNTFNNKGSGTITGSGVTNYVPKFSSSTAIGYSQIFDDGTNVGIGTTSPTNKLSVVGNILTSSSLLVGTASNAYFGSPARGLISIVDWDNEWGLVVQNAQIGSSYGVSLDVDNSGSAYLDAIVPSGQALNLLSSYDLITNSTNNTIFRTYGSERMRINSTGSVGIGTSSPSTKLDVAGGAKLGAAGTDTITLTGQVSANSSVGSAGQVLTSRGANLSPEWTTVSGGGGISGSGTTNYVPKFTGSTAIGNSQIFDNGTSVGIGTASPANKLTVSGNIQATDSLLAGTSSNTYLGYSAKALISMPNYDEYYGLAVQNAIAGSSYGVSLDVDDTGTAYLNTIVPSGGALTLVSTYDLSTYSVNNTIFHTNGVERMRIDSSGNVGIGTTNNPSSFRLYTDTNGVSSVGPASEEVCMYAYSGGAFMGTYSNTPLDIGVNGSNFISVTTAGDVGIGTGSPAAKLHVIGAVAAGGVQEYITNTDATGFSSVTFTEGTSPKAQIWVGNSSYTSFGGAGSINYSANGGSHVWYTNYYERMRIDSSGNVGIGTSSPASYSKFVIKKDVNSTTVLDSPSIVLSNRHYGTDGAIGGGLFMDVYRDVQDPCISAGVWFTRKNFAGVAQSSDIVFGACTNYGNSTALPTERARIFSTGGFSVGTTADPGAGAIYATGNITAYYSDDRLKTRKGNIENALDKVLSLDGFHYEANETAQALGYKAKPEVGLSAQQVQAVLPEVVVPAPIDEQYLTVHYERLIPLLVEAMKEQQAQIEELKALVANKCECCK